jgi:hypothetical protein
MENLTLWEKVRAVPKEAQKTITGGRLNGKTDINPIWRIKTLTEQYGVCGTGWKAEIVRAWVENGSGGEIAQYCHIKLFVKDNGEWSEGIDGVGGSMLVAKEKNGLYTNDEAIKMAYTDAISVACKSLGFGADIYWDKDKTKYDGTTQKKSATPDRVKLVQLLTAENKLQSTLDFYKVDKVEQIDDDTVIKLLKRLGA